MPESEENAINADKEVIERMVSKAKKIADVLRGFMGDIRIVSHHDADGICSASIFVKALAREGKGFHLTFIKQLYEDDIVRLKNEGNRIIVFLDMGSGQIETIQKHLIDDETRIIISDHHQVQGEIMSDNIMHLNPVEYGINENISGSGTTYMIARALNPENKDLSELAIVGAIGDSQTGAIGAQWGLFGINKEILKDAEVTKKIRVGKGLRIWGRTRRPIHKALEYSLDPMIPGVSGSESGAVHFLQELGINLRTENGEWKTLSSLNDEEMKKLTTGIIKERIRDNHENPEWVFGDVYDLLDKDGMSDANEFATILNSAGKQGTGYIGVALCLNNKDYFPLVDKMLNKYRREIGKSLRWVSGNKECIKTTDEAVFIHAGDNVPEHIASNVVSIINHSSDILPEEDSEKPVFMIVESGKDELKISARASDRSVEEGLSLQKIMTEAAAEAGGEGGGHAGAAGASIPASSEDVFINRVEDILKKSIKDITENENSKGLIEDGRTESEGKQEGSEEGKETPAQAISTEKGYEKEAERKGLVRYLSS